MSRIDHSKVGNWEIWKHFDPDGRMILYKTHFNGKFNHETAYRYNSNGGILYIKETDEGGGVNERWWLTPASPTRSMVDDLMLRRYTRSDSTVLYFDKDGKHTSKEEWEEAFAECNKEDDK
jgi:hypothetical protein